MVDLRNRLVTRPTLRRHVQALLQRLPGPIRRGPGGGGHRRPISSGIAESAVNQVVSMRMAKKQQMRWSDEGAHLLAQVRAHEINGDLRPSVVSIPLRSPKPTSHPWLDGYEFGEFRVSESGVAPTPARSRSR